MMATTTAFKATRVFLSFFSVSRECSPQLWRLTVCMLGLLSPVITQNVVTQNLFFQHTAEIRTVKGFFNVRFPIHTIQTAKASCEKLHQTFDLLSHQVFTAGTPGEKYTLLQIRSSAVKSCNEIHSWSDTRFPAIQSANTVPYRSKRQLALAAIAGTVFGGVMYSTVSGFFSHDSVDDNIDLLHTDMMKLRDTVHQLAESFAKQEDRFNMLLATNIVATQIEMEAMRFSSAFVHLLTHYRISSFLLPHRALSNFWKEFQDQIPVSDRQFQFTSHPEIIYELPASIKREQSEIFIEVQIPMLEDELTLYQLNRFPILLNEKKLLPDPSTSLIAVTKEHSMYYTPTANDMTACYVIGKFHLCPFPYLKKNFKNDCLSAIFFGHWKEVIINCQFVDANSPWYLVRGEGGWWHLHSDERLVYTMQCENGTTINNNWSPGFSKFKLDTQCRINTPLFTIPQSLQHLVRLQTIVRETQFDDSDLDQLRETTEMIKVPKVHALTSHMSYSAVFLSIIAVILVIIVIYFLYHLYVRQKQQKSPPPPGDTES